ncbi:hypothetical protein HYS48_01615, partial [Candidatus Woesearchaeota archaeon]|nr:hypothetical protein [Candidatus Woesearchaeota archaeon]
SQKYANREVDILLHNDYLLSAKVGKDGILKIKKNNKFAKMLMNAINMGEEVKLLA